VEIANITFIFSAMDVWINFYSTGRFVITIPDMKTGRQVFHLDIPHEAMMVNCHGTTSAHRILTTSACITPL
jgi:hypothetical protein